MKLVMAMQFGFFAALFAVGLIWKRKERAKRLEKRNPND